MTKTAEVLDQLQRTDLQQLQKELKEGIFQQLLHDSLADVPQSVCPICSTPVSDTAEYVLYFGKEVRRKARFDGIDCLRFFLKDMEKR
ncbi:MAG: hypothetical protein OXR66_07875 [Candidatus Woesearchaeota archaeon]|nr:hypothetical protein [Candidatus Woesearchaeota archaeon]